MHLIQFQDDTGARAVGATEGGTTSVVTGAGSGIGQRIAVGLAQCGADVEVRVRRVGVPHGRGGRGAQRFPVDALRVRFRC